MQTKAKQGPVQLNFNSRDKTDKRQAHKRLRKSGDSGRQPMTHSIRESSHYGGKYAWLKPNPLIRWLKSRVGQQWDAVYRELVSHCPSSFERKLLDDWVEIHVLPEENTKKWRGYFEVAEDGVLVAVECERPERREPSKSHWHMVEKTENKTTVLLKRDDGTWFEVESRPTIMRWFVDYHGKYLSAAEHLTTKGFETVLSQCKYTLLNPRLGYEHNVEVEVKRAVPAPKED